ncbi:MAG: nucleoside-diphosphate kinase, partial [Patescibacteria group bacterium]
MPEVERTLIIIKAHALTDNSPRQRILLVERALSEYGKLGLKTILKETIRITPEQAQEFYKEHRGKPYHAGLMDSIDGFSIIIILDGE